ncbi:MAG TPA: DUF1993 domain-containing protein [Gammaproteobacteria bacterium]
MPSQFLSLPQIHTFLQPYRKASCNPASAVNRLSLKVLEYVLHFLEAATQKDNPMAPSLVFKHYLKRLEAILGKIEIHRAECDNVFNASLYQDMFPLLQQAKVAIGFSLRACCPLAGMDIVTFKEDEMTLGAVRNELAATLAFIDKIPIENFDGHERRKVETVAGFAKHIMPGEEYYQLYALPNFMFHLSVVYAIARSKGVPLSKGDFDGYHEYPEGFRF